MPPWSTRPPSPGLLSPSGLAMRCVSEEVRTLREGGTSHRFSAMRWKRSSEPCISIRGSSGPGASCSSTGPRSSPSAESPGERDYKTRLQEVLAQTGSTPEYAVVGAGPDHERTFKATVVVDGKVLGMGAGTSKKRAQQVAARRALEVLGDDA